MSDENRVHIEPAGLGAEERQTSAEGSGAFSFDTSGHVNLGKAAFPFHNEYVEWSDLSPFVQGYVEALKQSQYALQLPPAMKPEDDPEGDISLDWEFSDLDPSALALILRDCERWQHLYPNSPDGARFWELRNLQLIERPDFPPLQPYLSDEGRVCLADASRSDVTASEGEVSPGTNS